MAGPMYEQILWHVPESRIAWITLNRPEGLNRFTHTMISEWTDAIERAKQDPDIKMVVVTGAGQGFCAGADVPGQPGTALHMSAALDMIAVTSLATRLTQN